MNTHEEILEALATGKLLESAEPALTELAESAELRERWQALKKVQSALGVMANERREVLMAARTTSRSLEEDQTLGAARAIFKGEETHRADRQPTRPLSIIPISIAAALLLGVGLWLIHLKADIHFVAGELPKILGSELELQSPVGEVLQYDEFRWNYKLTDGLKFEVTLWNEATGKELWTSPPLKVSRLSPPPGLKLPAHLRWEVWVLDAGGNSVATGAAEAFLRQ